MDRREEEQVDDPGVPNTASNAVAVASTPSASPMSPQVPLPAAPMQQPMVVMQLPQQHSFLQPAWPPAPFYSSAASSPGPAAPFYQAAAASSPGPASASPFFMPQSPQSQSPQSPSFNLNRQRYNLRSQLAPRVTLPWERRERAGRPNAGEALLKNLYELGLIQPGAASQAQGSGDQAAGYQRWAPMPGQAVGEPAPGFQRFAFPQPAAAGVMFGVPPQAHNAAQGGLPGLFQMAHVQNVPQAGILNAPQAGLQVPQAQVVLNSPQAGLNQVPQVANVPQAGLQVPPAASALQAGLQVPQAASALQAALHVPQPASALQAALQVPQAQAQNASPAQQGSNGFDCCVCRCSTPNGVLVPCGHKICSTCFEQQMAVKAECPDPRCTNVLQQSSFITFRSS